MNASTENGYSKRETMELAEITGEIELNRREIDKLLRRNEELEQRKAEVW